MEATQGMMMAREQANPYNIIVKDEDGGHAGDDVGQGAGEPLPYHRWAKRRRSSALKAYSNYMVSISVVVLWSWMRIILIRIRIQDPKKNRYGSGSRPNFDTDPEPGINDTNPDPGKKGFSTKKIIKIWKKMLIS